MISSFYVNTDASNHMSTEVLPSTSQVKNKSIQYYIIKFFELLYLLLIFNRQVAIDNLKNREVSANSEASQEKVETAKAFESNETVEIEMGNDETGKKIECNETAENGEINKLFEIAEKEMNTGENVEFNESIETTGNETETLEFGETTGNEMETLESNETTENETEMNNGENDKMAGYGMEYDDASGEYEDCENAESGFVTRRDFIDYEPRRICQTDNDDNDSVDFFEQEMDFFEACGMETLTSEANNSCMFS